MRVRYTTVAFCAALLSWGLFLAALLLPVLGVVISLFSGVPLLFVSLYAGRKEGIGVVAFVTLMLVLFGGTQESLLFIVQYGVSALVLAEAIRKGWSPARSILTAVGIALGVATMIVLAYGSVQQTNPLPLLKQEIKTGITDMLALYQEQGIEQEQLRLLQEYVDNIIDFFFYSFPALLLISFFVASSLTYFTVYRVWLRWEKEQIFPPFSLAHWSLPEYLIWALIAAGFLIFLPVAPVQFVAQNLLLVVLFFYLLQGLAIVHFYLQKGKIPFFLRGLGYVLLLIQPVFLLVVTALGVFDLWVDFRRIQ